MATYRSHGDGREVKASKSYTCHNCGGTIDRNEPYHNYHTNEANGNWQGRAHFDCQAAWWQGDVRHLLSALTSRASDPRLGSEVLEQITRVLDFHMRCLRIAQQDPKKALQYSHLLQQTAQILNVEVIPRTHKR